MEAARIATTTPAARLLGDLGLLADGTRGRMLLCLCGVELTVAELCDSLALPQSTVSRHLKLLADAGWVAARRDGTSRCYALTIDQLDESSRRLWEIVREDLAESVAVQLDLRRREQVLQRRVRNTEAFFSDVADEWDRLRGELFGATSDLQLLPALLDPDVVVGDLGCGSGRHRGDARALRARGRRRRRLARDARSGAFAPGRLRQRAARAGSHRGASARRPPRSISRWSCTCCTMWQIPRSPWPRSLASSVRAGGS